MPCGMLPVMYGSSVFSSVFAIPEISEMGLYDVLMFMSLFVLCVLCLTVLVNCLLNAFSICVGEVSVFSLKVMVLFLGCVGVLLASPCIVFQRVCVVFVIPVCV